MSIEGPRVRDVITPVVGRMAIQEVCTVDPHSFRGRWIVNDYTF